MRPKVLGDTFYFSVPEGVCLSNNHQIQHIKGKDTERLLDLLLPRLNGRQTLDEITGRLPSGKREVISRLVMLLIEKGFARDLALDLPHTLTQAEQAAYEAEIAFIRSFTHSAESRFERYRQSHVLLVGSGLTLTALVHAHMQNGLSRLNVMLTDECPTGRERLQEYLLLYRQRDPDQEIQLIEQPNWSDSAAVSQVLRPYAAVVHISDRPMLARARLLNQICLRSQKIFVQALIVGQSAWSGLFGGENEAGCWECAWHRLQANVSDPAAYAFEDETDAAISPFVAAPTAAVVANQLSFDLFKFITGAGPVEMAACLVETDLETLKSEHHRFLPHPFCTADQYVRVPSSQALRRAVWSLQESGTIEQEEFSRKSTLLYDSKLGLFSDLDEKDFSQIPLNVAQVTISNPLPQARQAEPLYAAAVGTDFGTPRRRATRRACEIYAAVFCDPRRLFRGTELSAKGHVRIYTQELTCACTPEPDELYTWGYLPTIDEICAIPAQLAFPTLLPYPQRMIPDGKGKRSQKPGPPCLSQSLADGSSFLNRAPGGQTSQEIAEQIGAGTSGVASGASWAEAVGRGLLALCKRLTLEEMPTAQEPFPQVDLSTLPLDETGDRYYRLIQLMRLPLQVYDITGSTGVPTFAFLCGDRTIAYACHCDPRQAWQEGLEQCLQQAQATANGQTAYALPAVPPLPTRLRGCPRSSAHRSVAEEAACSWSALQVELLTTLANLGYQAIIVPLDHDPALARVFPYLVRLLPGVRNA